MNSMMMRQILFYSVLLTIFSQCEAMETRSKKRKKAEIATGGFSAEHKLVNTVASISGLLVDENTSIADRDMLYQALGYHKPVERFIAEIEEGEVKGLVSYYVRTYGSSILTQSEKATGLNPFEASLIVANFKVAKQIQGRYKPVIDYQQAFTKAELPHNHVDSATLVKIQEFRDDVRL